MVHNKRTSRKCTELPPSALQQNISLPPVPHPGDFGVPHLLLQLQDTIAQCLTGGRTAGHIDVDRHYTVTASNDRVTVVVVSTSVRARSHGDDPAGLGHLIVDLSQSRSHLVGERTGDDHDIGLTGRGTENDSHAILIIARRRQVHHLDGTAGESKGHRPEGSLTSPVRYRVEGGPEKTPLAIIALASDGGGKADDKRRTRHSR